MMTILARHKRTTTRADWRRLLIAVALLALASLAWRLSRPAVIRAFACSSIGSHRVPLLRMALQERFPYIPLRENAWLESVRGPGAPFLAWTNHNWITDLDSRWHLSNGRMDYVGVLRAVCQIASFGDWDQDRYPEAMCLIGEGGELYFVVVRVRPAADEVVVVLPVHISTRNAAAILSVFGSWSDEDGNGTMELILRGTRVGGPSAVIRRWPDVIVAIFDWTAPGGVLTPRMLPDDGTVQFWPLPDNRPVVFDPNEPLESVVARLRPPDTQPACLPATPSGPDATP